MTPKEQFDQTKSKRPIPKMVDEEIAEKFERRIDIAEKELGLVDGEINWREKSSEYRQLVERSIQRCIRISIDLIDTDPEDIISCAMKRGQFYENLELTKSLVKLKNKRMKIMDWITSLKQMVLTLREKKGL
jgi:hypothetical protein